MPRAPMPPCPNHPTTTGTCSQPHLAANGPQRGTVSEPRAWWRSTLSTCGPVCAFHDRGRVEPIDATAATFPRAAGRAFSWISSTAATRLGAPIPTHLSTTVCSPNGKRLRRTGKRCPCHPLRPARFPGAFSSLVPGPRPKPWVTGADRAPENLLTPQGRLPLGCAESKGPGGEDIDDCRCGGHCPRPEEHRSHPRGRRLILTFSLRA